MGIGRIFRRMEDEGKKQMNLEELKEGMKEKGMEMNEEENKKIFEILEKDGSGGIDMEEFILDIRKKM